MDCKLCKIIEGKVKAKVVYEDAVSIAKLSDNPAALGHVEVFPKEHVDSIQALPEAIVEHLFTLANTTASALFQVSGAEGTNIIVYNGDHNNNAYPHLSISILPRKQNDGLNFQWKPKQLTPEEMDGMFSKIRDKAFMAEHNEKEKGKPKKELEVHKEGEEVITIEEENYLVKQLNRLP